MQYNTPVKHETGTIQRLEIGRLGVRRPDAEASSAHHFPEVVHLDTEHLDH